MEVRSDSVDLMSYIKWCDFLNCGCDVTCSAYDVIHIVAMMSYIHCAWPNWSTGCDATDTVAVMAGRVTVKLHNGYVVITLCDAIQSGYVINRVCDVRDIGIVWCHTYSECDIIHSRWHVTYSACDVINTQGCFLKGWIWCHVKCTWWHTSATCDVLYSWCDVFDRVGVVTYTVDVMTDWMCFNSDIEIVLS